MNQTLSVKVVGVATSTRNSWGSRKGSNSDHFKGQIMTMDDEK